MNTAAPHSDVRWARPDLRLALFGLSGVAAAYVGFLGLSVPTAEYLVKRGGYYVMLAAFGLFLHALWRLYRARSGGGEPLTRRQKILTGLTIAVFSVVAVANDRFQSKILYDEFVLQSTAFNMHFFRDVATMVRGYDIQGVFLSTDNYLDKRPYFYPFVVSLVHDLTGYRPLNAYYVNAALMPVSLGLVFLLGRRLAKWAGGMLAVLLLGSLPLLGQNATGSGMELLNVVMILATILLGAEYLRRPDEDSLAALLLCAALLAQARYESALYVGPAALIAGIGWVRARRIILPWQAIVLPWLLVPVALQNKVLSNSPMLWELTEQANTRFSLSYVPANLRGARDFFFNTSQEMANSLFLSVLAPVALLWGLWRAARAGRRLIFGDPASVALGTFALAIVANTALVFCYYWSSFSDPMAARFSLPLYLLIAFLVVLLAGALDRKWMVTPLVIAATVLFAAGVSAGRFAGHHYSHLGIDEIEWERRFVDSLPPAPRLVITNRSTLPWLVEKTPSILIDRARQVADRLQYQLRDTTFKEILVTQALPPTTADGDYQILPAERLPGFHLELLAERRFGSKLVRISRLVTIDDSVLPSPRAPAPKVRANMQ
ncbi:MAG TPA: glycosyltransferase family 39 protein [Candidatus Didemnitutus sp.]|nr:glycosyltransferase family 39 protein [Candidatus Didemnitutus sp.]